MNKNYSIEYSGDLTIVRLHKHLELDELLDVVDDVAGKDKNHRRLWDLSRCFAYSNEQIQQLASHARRLLPGPSQVAFVAENDLAFGLLRVFESYRHETDFQTMVFRGETEARAWFDETRN